MVQKNGMKKGRQSETSSLSHKRRGSQSKNQKTNSQKTTPALDVRGKLGVFGLAGIVVSSMIGGGIFSLPQNMAQSAAVGAIILAWLITGLGMYFVANTFRILSDAKPDLTSGVYMYVRSGFGPYMGFNIGWSYWLCQIFGNVGYAVITMDALNYFFPGIFAGGNNLYSVIGGSFLIWFFNFLVMRGVQQATMINLVVTIAKIVPLVLFIIIMVAVFNIDQFDFDFWGDLSKDRVGSLGTQIKHTMLVTLWAFIGIEGAVVLSGRAEKQSYVGRATVIGYLGCLAIYVLLSVLPFGYMNRIDIANVSNPSTAGILEMIVGPWGAWFMNIGLIIAILASWLSWTMIVMEMPYAMAKNGTFPKIFGRENQSGTPQVSLFVTSSLMQATMILVYFSKDAWNTMLSITGVMVLPAYLMSCMFLWRLCVDDEFPKNVGISRFAALLTGFFGTMYSVWMIYAAGFSYLLMAVVFIACGIPVYIWARKNNMSDREIQSETRVPLFSEPEKAMVISILAIAVVSLYAFSRGLLHF